MRGYDNPLFRGEDLATELRFRLESITEMVGSISSDQLRATPEDDLVAHIESRTRIEPLTIYEDRAEFDKSEIEVDVSGDPMRNLFGDGGSINIPGVQVVVSVPFTGEAEFWDMAPSTRYSTIPYGDVLQSGSEGGVLEITIEQPADTPNEQIKARLDEQLDLIRRYIEPQRNQVEQFNMSIRQHVIVAVQARKARLQKTDGMEDLLGISLKRKPGTPAMEPLPIKRKLVRPLPPPPRSGFQPKHGITDKDYQHILDVIGYAGRTFESTPETYAVHDEEELRNIVLSHLDGHYDGGASGETFRKNGKTDILIKVEGRAAFVGECKIWKGPKQFADAIDQLLGYLTWRDCKAAVVVFNKHNAGFSDILAKIPAALREHGRFKRELDLPASAEEGEWRVALDTEDEGRQVIVHVFAFDLFVRA